MKWLAALLHALLAGPVVATEAPLWEFGVGVGVLSISDYRGLDESMSIHCPYPNLLTGASISRWSGKRCGACSIKGSDPNGMSAWGPLCR